MIKSTVTCMNITLIKVNGSRNHPVGNKHFSKKTNSLPMTKGEVKANVLQGNSTLQPSFVKSLEVEVEKPKNPEQLTFVRKKKSRRRNRKKRPVVVEDGAIVQEPPRTNGLTSDNLMSSIMTLSLRNEKSSNTVVSPPRVGSSVNGVNEDTGISHASFPKLPLSQPRKKLLILDINGILADIVSPPPKEHKADRTIARRAVFQRPACRDFLKFCFEHFEVGVWSSRSEKIATRVLDYLIGDMKHKLLFCWDLSRCTATGFRTLENRHKTLVFKELRKIWEKQDPDLPWEKGEYNESNTLLLDDSPYKALLNPAYTAVFPDPYRFGDIGSDSSLGPGSNLRAYLEELSVAKDVQKFVEQNPFGQRPITESSSSWGFYLKVPDGRYLTLVSGHYPLRFSWLPFGSQENQNYSIPQNATL